MLKSIIFLTITVIISGCGMMGSNSKSGSCPSTSTSLTDQNSVGSLDINISEDQITIARDDNTQEGESEPSSEGETEDEVDTDISLSKRDILPQTISMEIPEILIDDKSLEVNETNVSEESNIDIDEDDESIDEGDESNETEESSPPEDVNDIGYQQLKKNISQIEDIVIIAKVNLVLLEQAMPQVLERCDGMISCIFEPRFLSIVLDNETISQIDTIIDDSNITWIDENSTNRLYLGKLEFSKFDTNESDIFSYELTLDMASDNIKLAYNGKDRNGSDRNVTEYQTFKWSDDNKNVTTNYFYEDNISTINISIFYFVDDDGKETMHVYNMNSNDNLGVQENMNLTLSDKEDDNSTVVLQSNSIEHYSDGNESNISSFSANAEISDDSSILSFSGTVQNENRDLNVTHTSELSCDNNSSCEDSRSVPSLEFYELKIKGGDLEDGSYILLPPNIDIKGLKLIDIFGLTLGTFTIFENKAQGEIHNNSYNDIIDELTIIKIVEMEDSSNMFEVISEEKRPTIEIINY